MPRHKNDAANQARSERKQAEKKFGPKIKKPIKKAAQTSVVFTNTEPKVEFGPEKAGWVSYKFTYSFSVPIFEWAKPPDPEAYEQTTIDFDEGPKFMMIHPFVVADWNGN